MRRVLSIGVIVCLGCGGAAGGPTEPSPAVDTVVPTDAMDVSDEGPLNPPGEDTQTPVLDARVDTSAEVREETVTPDVPNDGRPGTETEPLVLPAPQSGGYTQGGVLARYFAGGAASADTLPEDPFLFRLEPDLDQTVASADFAGLNEGKPFTAHYVGGLEVTGSGVYQLTAMANDGLRLQLAGVTALEFWDMGAKVTQSVWLALEPGWYPLDLVYKRRNWDAHMQVWWGVEGALLSPLKADSLGYPSAVPPELSPLSGTAQVLSSGLTQVHIGISASAPSNVTITAVSPGQAEIVVSLATPTVAVEKWVPLAADATWTITVSLEDLWGRTAELAPMEVVTGAVPTFTAGGILGTVYQGGDYKAFETPVASRVDPVINHPDSLDGNGNGSFLLPIAGDDFAIRWQGGLYVETTGDYVLYLGADDGQRLFVDGVLVVDLWSDHGLLYVPAPLSLVAGWHTLEVHMYENGGGAAAILEWESETMARQVIAAENLGYLPPSDDGLSPVVTNITASNESDGEIKVELWTSELCSGTLTVTQADAVQTVELLAPADAFQWWGSGFDVGEVSIEAVLTDTAGNAVTTEPITLMVP